MDRHDVDNVVQVRSVVGEETLSLRFRIKGREHRLLRDKQEPVGKALKRIVTNLSRSGKDKKKKKISGRAEAEAINHVLVEVHLYSRDLEGGREISPETANQEAWVSSNTFTVDGIRFAIAVNTPTVKHLQLPACIMATCPTIPLVPHCVCVSNTICVPSIVIVSVCRWNWSLLKWSSVAGPGGDVSLVWLYLWSSPRLALAVEQQPAPSKCSLSRQRAEPPSHAILSLVLRLYIGRQMRTGDIASY